ncbi:hypothetical protein jhhlp_004734 [Lomentospora prolificans]|uniref:CBM1 domain-containing protein n=1 Tax=Lomentospora prolificans TaxID=41688 RepID=A0A2N3N898_9PEZI|nr:hypothetical protein jhhlp_004734 [Lomentospora prolificans]
MVKASIVGAMVLAGLASAQQTVWGQCGGIGWTGPTTCVTGTYCKHYNDWYFQCIPGNDPDTPSSTTLRTSTTAPPTSSTTSSAPATTTTSAGGDDEC